MRKAMGMALASGFLVAAMIAGTHPALAQDGARRGPGGPGAQGGGPMAGGLAQAFDRIDTDGDGKVSKSEYAEFMWGRISRVDADKDGKLTRQEMSAMRGPFGREGARGRGAGRGMGPGMGRPGRGGGASSTSFESPVRPKDDAEKKILDVLDDMNKNQRRGNMNVPEEDGRLLRLLTETVGARRVAEIGTSTGYSGIWFCLALRNTGGKLTTYEIDERRASIARQNFKRAGVDGIVTLVEGDAHKEVPKLKDPIDVLFLDADKEGYIDYLEKLLPLVRPGGLVIAHNMNPRQADPDYLEAITTNPALETLFLHMQGSGVAVTMKKR